VGEHVLLKLKPKKGSLNLRKCTNLAFIFCIPFEILDILGSFAYMLALPTSMNVHNVFHVSLLKNNVHDPNHVIDWNLIWVDLEEEFEVQPMHILNTKVKML
jgi:hypothetical protein